jgi:ArsR family transcriptional regulator
MDAEQIADCARLLRILAHPTRLMILAELLEAEKCVGDIQDLLAVPQPNVSQHLAALKESGLVASRKDGARRCYHLVEPRLVKGLFAWLARRHPAVEHTTARV